MIRVLVADDQALLRDGLQVILGAAGDIAVVGAAADGVETLAMALELRPDVVLCDLRMPGDGLTAIAGIIAAWPTARVVALTTYDDADLVRAAVHAGACGYLLKDLPAADLVAAVRAVAAGQVILQPAGSVRVLIELRGSAPAEPARPLAGPGGRLTPRELEVLALMAEGLRNTEIAVALVVSAATVKTHVNNIFTKLGCRDRAAAVAIALRAAGRAGQGPGSPP